MKYDKSRSAKQSDEFISAFELENTFDVSENGLW